MNKSQLQQLIREEIHSMMGNNTSSAYDEVENANKAKRLANLLSPGDEMLQLAAADGANEVLLVGADAVGSGSSSKYAYDGVFTQYDFMLMFRKAGYSRAAIEILMDSDYIRGLERG